MALAHSPVQARSFAQDRLRRRLPQAPRMRAILDSGPLIALWNDDPELRDSVKESFQKLTGPYHVSEPVLTEVAHLTGRDRQILEALRTGKFLLTEGLLDQLDDLQRLLEKYPHCDLADASIVALSERHRRMDVLTTDR